MATNDIREGQDQNYLIDKLRALLTRNIDMSGRRVINAGDAIDPQDYVTLRQLKDLNGNLTSQAQFTSSTSTFKGNGPNGTGSSGSQLTFDTVLGCFVVQDTNYINQ